MKLFISNARLRFAALTLMFLLFASSFSPPVHAQGQGGTPTAYSFAPYVNKWQSYSQMWNISNTYTNGITGANLGNQLDTTTNTTTLYLSTSKWVTGFLNAQDSFVYTPVNGNGTITLTANGLKCTGTPTVTVAPERSQDGIHWSGITGVTTVTLTPTSLTIPVSVEFTFSDKRCSYYRLNITGSSSSTTSWYASSYFQASAQYELKGP